MPHPQLHNVKQLLFILLLLPVQLFAQQSEQWLREMTHQQFPYGELKPQNFKTSYSNADFSPLLKPKTPFLGFIGSDYKRIKMEFISVEKEKHRDDQYSVRGFSVVGTNRCDFEGTLTIQQVREFKKMHYGVDAMYRDSTIHAQGILLCEYRFEENPAQNHVGTFEGVMTLWWYRDDLGMRYDAIENFSDRYRNNQFVGIWTAYGKTQGKICNWGEYRIPFSGDLDIGAGEFAVNPKYIENGWSEFK